MDVPAQAELTHLLPSFCTSQAINRLDNSCLFTMKWWSLLVSSFKCRAALKIPLQSFVCDVIGIQDMPSKCSASEIQPLPSLFRFNESLVKSVCTGNPEVARKRTRSVCVCGGGLNVYCLSCLRIAIFWVLLSFLRFRIQLCDCETSL